MGSWTDTTRPELPAGARPLWRAVIRPERLDRTIVREVLPGAGPLAGWVEQVWSLAWARPVPASLSALISHPTIHLTVEAGPPGERRHGHALPAELLHGVVLERFGLDLPAFGWVVGLHLVPGAIMDLTGVPAYRWTGRVVPWAAAWPDWDLTPVWDADGPAARAQALRAVAETMIGDRVPSPDGRRARTVERLARDDRGIRTVEELAARVALSVRALQRLCRDHLGVTPRWLLRRARVLDAHELLSTTELEIAEIAHRLGWYDQAHLTRDYTKITGVPPAAQRRILETDRS
ncbi:helix-turn-helix domain-containing protein [Naumannella huperziae]